MIMISIFVNQVSLLHTICTCCHRGVEGEGQSRSHVGSSVAISGALAIFYCVAALGNMSQAHSQSEPLAPKGKGGGRHTHHSIIPGPSYDPESRIYDKELRAQMRDAQRGRASGAIVDDSFKREDPADFIDPAPERRVSFRDTVVIHKLGRVTEIPPMPTRPPPPLGPEDHNDSNADLSRSAKQSTMSDVGGDGSLSTASTLGDSSLSAPVKHTRSLLHRRLTDVGGKYNLSEEFMSLKWGTLHKAVCKFDGTEYGNEYLSLEVDQLVNSNMTYFREGWAFGETEWGDRGWFPSTYVRACSLSDCAQDGIAFNNRHECAVPSSLK